MEVDPQSSSPNQTEAGLRLTNQAAVNADAVVDVGETTPADLHAELVGREGVRAAVVDAILSLARGQTPAEFDEVLKEIGVPATTPNRDLRFLARRVASGDVRGLKKLFETLPTLGQGHSTTEEMLVVPRLLAHADRSLTFAFRIGSEFLNRRRDQREAICEYWSALARGTDVRLISGGLTLHKLARLHHTDLPGSVREQCSRSTSGAGTVHDAVEAAWEELDVDGPYFRTLAHIGDAASETRTYDELEHHLSIPRSTVRRHVSTLQDLDLISETFDHHGCSAVELRKAGRLYLNRVEEEIGRQRRLDEMVQGGVHENPNSSDNAVSPTGEHGEPPTPTSGDHIRYRLPHLHQVRTLSRWETAAATGTARDGAISLVNFPVEQLEDRAAPGWGYDERRKTAVFSAEWDNPLQFGVCIARASTDYLTWQQILTEEVLEGADVAGMFEDHQAHLRTTRCFGYLPETIDNIHEFVESLRDAGDELANLTKRLAHGDYDDRDQFRGVVTRNALGLYCIMVHLLDLFDADVVIESRTPTYSKDFDEDRRDELVQNLVKMVTLGSKYGDHVAHRQLYEPRPDKRRQKLDPTVDAADPLGELIPSFVHVGDLGGKGPDLAAALRDRLSNPAELQDDAPEFAVPVDVVEDHDRAAYAGAARRALEHKSLEVTREAVSLLHGFCRTPYDAVEALAQLGKEPWEREVRPSEVRYALAQLDADRLVPDATPTVRKVLKALLAAEAPLSKSELAAAAGVSRDSLTPASGNWEALLATGLVEETGSGWRLDLAFHSDEELHADRLPELVTDDLLKARDVLQDALFDVVDDVPVEAFEVWIDLVDGVPDVGRLRRWFGWADWVVPLLRRLAGQEYGTVPEWDPPRSRVAFGADLEQASILDRPSAIAG